LLGIAHLEASKFGITDLSSNELLNILKNPSAQSLIESTRLTCEYRLSLTANVLGHEEFTILTKIWNFVYTHPLEIIFTALTVSIFCLSFYNVYFSSSSLELKNSLETPEQSQMVQELTARVQNLENDAIPLLQNRVALLENSSALSGVENGINLLNGRIEVLESINTNRVPSTEIREHILLTYDFMRKAKDALIDQFNQTSAIKKYLLENFGSDSKNQLTLSSIT
jgi:hypothetical protein